MEGVDIEIETAIKTLIPLHDRVVVQRIEAQTMAARGIFIPEKVQEKSAEATVLSIGPGKMLEDGRRIPISGGDGTDLKIGDKILFAKYGGLDFSINLGEELTILREDEILGKIQVQAVKGEVQS